MRVATKTLKKINRKENFHRKVVVSRRTVVFSNMIMELIEHGAVSRPNTTIQKEDT